MRKLISAPALIVAAALALAACGESPKPSPARRSLAVQVVTVQYRSVPGFVEAPGSVQARSRIALAAQVNGFVRSVAVKAGDPVVAGQTLVVLDARDAQSQKDLAQASVEEAQAAMEEARKGAQVAADMRGAAKANADLANATFQRFQKLFDSKSVSPQELDEARARRDGAAADLSAKETMVSAAHDRLKQVEARIEQATAQSRRADVVVGYTVIKAPAAGRIAERQVDPGTAIFPGSPLMVVETVANPQVLAEMPTAQTALLRIGLEVDVRVSDSGPPVKGRITEIVPMSNPATHTVQFKVDLPPGAAAPTGSYARVRIPAASRNLLLVPLKSVREMGQLTGVFTVDSDSKARFRLVKIAPFDAENAELLSGVEPGERVVSLVTDELADGITLEARS